MRRRTRITETFYLGPFRIGASATRSSLRGFVGVRTSRRTSTSVSFPVWSRRNRRRS